MDTISTETTIHLVLKDLIEKKSKRDHSQFTLAQLARALDMPHSILSKLTHEDPSKRVSNPRIDTLQKIVQFFQKDGFPVTLDSFLQGLTQTNSVEVDPQAKSATNTRALPLYFFDSPLQQKIGMAEVEINSESPHLIALISDAYIEPIFKKGSLFVVDTALNPEDGTLVAVQLPTYPQILIRKLRVLRGKHELLKHDKDESPITLHPTQNYRIIGVVIQVNAKT